MLTSPSTWHSRWGTSAPCLPFEISRHHLMPSTQPMLHFRWGIVLFTLWNISTYCHATLANDVACQKKSSSCYPTIWLQRFPSPRLFVIPRIPNQICPTAYQICWGVRFMSFWRERELCIIQTRQLSTKWVPRILKPVHKLKNVDASRTHLTCFQANHFEKKWWITACCRWVFGGPV